MEDAATAEIARTQLWQWLHSDGLHLDDGTPIDFALFERAFLNLPARLGDRSRMPGASRINEAIGVLDRPHPRRHARGLPHPAGVRAPRLTRDHPHHRSAIRCPTIRYRKEHRHEHACRPPNNSTTTGPPTRAGPASRAPTPPRTSCACAAPCRSSIRSPSSAREKLWSSLHSEPFVNALGALTGNQAMQQVKAGLKAIYLSGWQVAADANIAGEMYPGPVAVSGQLGAAGRQAHQQHAAARRPDPVTPKATTTSTSCSRSSPTPRPASAACSTRSS